MVARGQRTSEIIKKQLEDLLGDIIQFDCLSLESGIEDIISADLVLVATRRLAGLISKQLLPETDVLVIKRTINVDKWRMIMALPPQTEVLLVNDEHEVTIETIALLYELGAKHLKMVPYYPGLEPISKVNIAITPGNPDIVPLHVEKIIDIGNRVIDSSTVLDILSKLNLLNKKTSEIVINHMNKTMPLNPCLMAMLSHITESKQHLALLLDVVNEGLIAFNEDDKIIIFNKVAERIFASESWQLVGESLGRLFYQEELGRICAAKELHDEVYNINGSLFVVSKYLLIQKDKPLGGVITLKECNEIERLGWKFRKDIRRKGHTAKYTFSDIIGRSLSIQNAITTAKKAANGTSAVLIEGESGTGKELFAQAIHNSSERKDQPFVAFNCAALSDSLIESELFGYEEGAFTGAKKGGKPGLFELAHNGTIFLDEIGDISKNMQARLLRVLQEKEVIRVGGTTVIPIDVRVIAATNQNMLKVVNAGGFRRDLFYRLNVLYMRVPNLRDRKDDIPYLVDYFLRRKKIKKDIPKGVMGILQMYDWPGNVRELENCIEYMVSNYSGVFSSRDLPFHIMEAIAQPETIRDTPEELLKIGTPNELVIVLRVLELANKNGEKIGRRVIAKRLKEYGLLLTEMEVRSRLDKLAQNEMIAINRGRAGTKILPKGSALIRNI